MSKQFEDLLDSELNQVRSLLLDKNKRYGNSALEPARIFSKSDSVEQIKVRIDDKLNRIRTIEDGDIEDTERDLVGYLILLRIAKRWRTETNEEK